MIAKPHVKIVRVNEPLPGGVDEGSVGHRGGQRGEEGDEDDVEGHRQRLVPDVDASEIDIIIV